MDDAHFKLRFDYELFMLIFENRILFPFIQNFGQCLLQTIIIIEVSKPCTDNIA